MTVKGETLIESELWERIRPKLYLPHDVDEYKTSSRSLTSLSHNIFLKSCSKREKPLKMGYMVDICRAGCITPCAVMLGLIYLQRLSKSNPGYLSCVPSSDLFLVLMVIASKYLQDEGELEALVNSEWADIGQRSKSSIDSMEQDFLQAIDWRLFVSQEDYRDFVRAIEAEISRNEAQSRGWWSYTDLTSVWDASDTRGLLGTVIKQCAKTMGTGLAVYLVTFTALFSASHSLSGILHSDTRTAGLDSSTACDVTAGNDHSTSYWICSPVNDTRHPVMLDTGLVESEEVVDSLVHCCCYCFEGRNQSHHIIPSFNTSFTNTVSGTVNLIIPDYGGGGSHRFDSKHCLG